MDQAMIPGPGAVWPQRTRTVQCDVCGREFQTISRIAKRHEACKAVKARQKEAERARRRVR